MFLLAKTRKSTSLTLHSIWYIPRCILASVYAMEGQQLAVMVFPDSLITLLAEECRECVICVVVGYYFLTPPAFAI